MEIADVVVEIAGGVVAMEIAGVVVMEIAGVIVVVAGRSQGAVVAEIESSQIANEAGSGNRRRGCSSRRNLAGTLSLGLQGWCDEADHGAEERRKPTWRSPQLWKR